MRGCTSEDTGAFCKGLLGEGEERWPGLGAGECGSLRQAQGRLYGPPKDFGPAHHERGAEDGRGSSGCLGWWVPGGHLTDFGRRRPNPGSSPGQVLPLPSERVKNGVRVKGVTT